MTDTDITALVKRLRLAVQRLTIDISDAGMAADALEALQDEVERLTEKFENRRNYCEEQRDHWKARAEKAEAALEGPRPFTKDWPT